MCTTKKEALPLVLQQVGQQIFQLELIDLFLGGGGVGSYLHDPDPQMILCGAEVTSFRNKRDPLRALLSPEAVLIHMQMRTMMMMSSSQAVNTHMVVLDTGFRRRCCAAKWSELFWLTKEQKHQEREKLLFLDKLHSSQQLVHS